MARVVNRAARQPLKGDRNGAVNQATDHGCWRRAPAPFIRDDKEYSMKRILQMACLGIILSAGVSRAEPVRDWKDLERVHKHVDESIHEMERARAANHYDMAGHGAKAEELLRQVEHELHEAIEAAKAAK
jgi:hypothetical protein